jgi:hypothetical protein
MLLSDINEDGNISIIPEYRNHHKKRSEMILIPNVSSEKDAYVIEFKRTTERREVESLMEQGLW